MPELPEVEHLKRTIEPLVVGQRVSRVQLRRRDVIHGFNAGRISHAQLLQGQRIRVLHRHGKHLALEAASGLVLCIHLGMSGQLRLLAARERACPASHIHCVWHFAEGSKVGRMIFRDPRRFGGIWVFQSLEHLHDHRWNRLGPDALNIRPTKLRTAFRRTTRTIKTVLLDQKVIAGLGNIYVDEVLFRAGIHPATPADHLCPSQVDQLLQAIRRVLTRAISAGGSSLRDYVDATGQVGSFRSQHSVYGRTGLPCVHCGNPLCSMRLAQRTTVYCPLCQAPQR